MIYNLFFIFMQTICIYNYACGFIATISYVIILFYMDSIKNYYYYILWLLQV